MEHRARGGRELTDGNSFVLDKITGAIFVSGTAFRIQCGRGGVSEMRRGRGLLAGATVLAICLYVSQRAPSVAEVVTAQTPSTVDHRAVAITEAGDAVLRDDGRVIGFNNKTGEAENPVFVEGLADIVDVAGSSEDGLGSHWPRGSAYWIALRRDGIVLQWDGYCAEKGIYSCSFSRATIVPGVRNVISIASSGGTHLAVDSDGRAWGWGLDHDGLITGQKGKRDASGRQVPRLIKSPIRIPVPAALKEVAVGFPHSIGIDRMGNIWLWGGDDRPQFLPERSETSTVGEFVARKILGVPSAHSVAADGRTFVVTDLGELWSWGVTNPDPMQPNGTRVPHKVEGICPVKSVSSGASMVAAVCEDGAVYKMIFPGTPSSLGERSCETCGRIIVDEHWEKEQSVKDVESLHLAYFPSNAAVAMIDRSGSVYLGPFFGPGIFLPARERIIGPVNIDPQGSK